MAYSKAFNKLSSVEYTVVGNGCTSPVLIPFAINL